MLVGIRFSGLKSTEPGFILTGQWIYRNRSLNSFTKTFDTEKTKRTSKSLKFIKVMNF